MRTGRRTARIAGVGVLAIVVAAIAVGSLLVALTPEVPADLRPPRVLVFDVVALALAGSAALILWGHPHTVGWLLAVTAVLTALANLFLFYAAAAVYGGRLPGGTFAAWVFAWSYVLGSAPLITLVPLFFPDGRLPSPRWRPVAWAALAGVAGWALAAAVLPAPVPMIGIPNPFGARDLEPFVFGLFNASVSLVIVASIGAAASVAWRFRTASAVVRQQIKWLAVGSSLVVVVAFAALLLELSTATVAVVINLAVLTVPAAITLAILRYRLYDIDLVINRTLVYGAVSATLLATYFGSVLLLQTLLRPFISGSEVAVAGSTLAVVALFAPLRRRIQVAVDRRFYRSRYDAARTLDAFGARLRDEVDLDSVRADLLDAVHDTVRPAHASVWLRERAE